MTLLFRSEYSGTSSTRLQRKQANFRPPPPGPKKPTGRFGFLLSWMRWHRNENVLDRFRLWPLLGVTGPYLRRWALPEKLAIVQPIKNFPAFYGTRKYITVFTRALHWSLSWARSIQAIPPHPLSLRSILILSTHLRLGLPSGLFPISIHRLPFVLHALPSASSLTWSF
jgi:hypothetical protein